MLEYYFSWLSFFSITTFVAKGVFAVLLMASVMAWSIALDKHLSYQSIERSIALFWRHCDHTGWVTMAENLKKVAHYPFIALQTAHTWWLHYPKDAEHSLLLDQSLKVTESRHLQALEDNLQYLAIIGSNGLYVGLLGTVCGVLHTFHAMGASLSITTIAPGIAESLWSTVVALLATLPAVVSYQQLSHRLNGISQGYEDIRHTLLVFQAHESHRQP
jgi:biopolymer transport protein TolQ